MGPAEDRSTLTLAQLRGGWTGVIHDVVTSHRQDHA